MADYTYDGGRVAPASGNVATLANWAGAVVSLALVLGVGVWGYKLIARDVSGVPVVVAMEGPMRISPEKPGGEMADHMGLAVNAVAGSGTAAPPADRLVLAPVPAGLAEEDVATGLIQRATPQPVLASLGDAPQVTIPADSPLAQALGMDQTPTGAETGTDTGAAEGTDVDALVAQMIAGVAPLTPLAAGQDAPVVTELASESAPAPGPGLARSLRPQPRPSGLRVAALDPVAAALAAVQGGPAPAATELDADALPEGTRLVQIGAFDSPDDARSAWTGLDARFGDYLEGKSRVIQKASSGGRVFYRLRAHGFEDLSDARRFCAALVAGNVDCIPVVTR